MSTKENDQGLDIGNVKRLIDRNLGELAKLEGKDKNYFELFHTKAAAYTAEHGYRLMVVNSWRYNIGRLICNIAKSPWSVVKNCVQFAKFSYRKSGLRNFFVKKKAKKIFSKNILSMAREGRFLDAAVNVEELRKTLPHGQITLIWNELLLARNKFSYSENMEFMREAYALFPSAQLAKIFAKYSFRLGDLTLSLEMVEHWLSELEPENITDVRWLQIFKGWSYLFHTEVKCPQKTVENYQPIDRKAFYFLHNSLPIHSGGYATRTHSLLLEMKSFGFQMEAYTRLGYPSDQFGEQSPDEAEVEISPLDTVDGIRYHRILGAGIGYRRLPIDSYMQAATKFIEARIEKEKPSIVHAASNYYTGLPAGLAAKKYGVPFIYEVRGLWEITRISREPKWAETDQFQCYKKMETTVAKIADRVIALNGALKDELIQRGVDADKIVIVPNSVNTDRFQPIAPDEELRATLGIQADEVVIGFVGTFAAYEGLDDLVSAFDILKKRGVKFKALMVGDGAVWNSVKKKVEESGLQSDVIITGRVPHDQVNSYYSLIDICPYPRKPQLVAEMVTPMKPFEAMAMEKVVLVSSVKAMAEFIEPGRNGVVFEKGSIDSLAHELESLVKNPEERMRLGKGARQWAIAERSWQHSAKIVEKLYEELTQTTH